MTSYVYFVQSQHGGAIKIGVSDNPEQRLIQLQTAYPHKLVIVKRIECDNRRYADELERSLHDRFQSQRLSGEWFDITIHEVQYEINWALGVADCVNSEKVNKLHDEIEALKTLVEDYKEAAELAGNTYSRRVAAYAEIVRPYPDGKVGPFQRYCELMGIDLNEYAINGNW